MRPMLFLGNESSAILHWVRSLKHNLVRRCHGNVIIYLALFCLELFVYICEMICFASPI